tara:strand:- start:1732 stop:2268 length:537 start_codon:yes stop_codon:yes gene_type:complete
MPQNISQFETCPSCNKPKHLDIEECPYCGVIYKKVALQAEDFGPQAQMDLDLLEKWQSLLEDYENLNAHEDFLQMALMKKNLPFASQQYRKILEVNPNDELAKKMQDKIINLVSVSFMSTKRDVGTPKKPSYMTYLFVFLAISFSVLAMIVKKPSLYFVAAFCLLVIFAVRFLKNRFE